MAKEKIETVKVIVVADEVAYDDKNYKQGDSITMPAAETVLEGLLISGAVMKEKDFKSMTAEQEAEKKRKKKAQEEAEKRQAEEEGDGSR